MLREAHNDAEETGCDIWRFAVTLAELTATGLWQSDLRWLVAVGVVQHAEQIRRPGQRRQLRVGPERPISNSSSFVLTASGAEFVRSQSRPATGKRDTRRSGEVRPRWDAVRSELTLGGKLVKQFRRPAACQKVILAAFEEEGWPSRIDDPLCGKPSGIGRERLHEIVRRLNQCQAQARIRFKRDGTGKGVTWAVEAAESE